MLRNLEIKVKVREVEQVIVLNRIANHMPKSWMVRKVKAKMILLSRQLKLN